MLMSPVRKYRGRLVIARVLDSCPANVSRFPRMREIAGSTRLGANSRSLSGTQNAPPRLQDSKTSGSSSWCTSTAAPSPDRRGHRAQRLVPGPVGNFFSESSVSRWFIPSSSLHRRISTTLCVHNGIYPQLGSLSQGSGVLVPKQWPRHAHGCVHRVCGMHCLHGT
jgi:hypothetical protein